LKNDKKTGAGSPICQILQLAIWDLLKLVQKNNPPFAGLVTTILGDIPKKKNLDGNFLLVLNLLFRARQPPDCTFPSRFFVTGIQIFLLEAIQTAL